MRTLIATAIVVASFATPQHPARAGEFGHGLGSSYAGLLRDDAGNLYGTMLTCCDHDGEIFKIAPDNTITDLHDFNASPTDGGNPKSDLVRDASGNLYGTTEIGGSGSCGCGVVYKMAPDGTETVLYNFLGGSDGASPVAGLVLDASGNLYGTTPHGGGACSDNTGCGTVFRLTSGGVETVLHAFTNGSDGAYPRASVILDKKGNLYGAAGGGSGTFGDIFKIGAAGTFKVLLTFSGGADGGGPFGRLLRDGNGNLYGTTNYGGANGYGTVFEFTPAVGESVLHSFTNTDGTYPAAGLISDKSGNLYGTTQFGGSGSCGCGTVFKLAPNGAETTLHSFFGGDGDGAQPLGVLLRDKWGNLYGTTLAGFVENGGGIFIITP
jgi:uncharacterized repeat protein (TIGR03803 family)